MARRDEIRHPNPVLAVDFGLRMTFDTLDQATLYADIQRTHDQAHARAIGRGIDPRVFELPGRRTARIGTPTSWTSSGTDREPNQRD